MVTIHADGSIYSDIDQLKDAARRIAAAGCKAIRSIDLSDCELPDVDLSEEICILEQCLKDLST